MSHAALVRGLADRLRRLDISSLVYFHTDHFEPWRPIGSAPAVGSEVVDSLHEFLRMSERREYARRLTLFYKPHLNYALRWSKELRRADPTDLVGFLPRAEFEERFGREAMRPFACSSGHEIQLHIHHEYYTATRAHTDPKAAAWFATGPGKAFDAQRLELAIRLNRDIIAQEMDLAPERWFFVHGQWALNASDDTGCTITNEIEILQRSGCCGDFTFPAAQSKINPRITVPYLCLPVDAPKGYDRPEAEPEMALGNRAAASRKFFIWASVATAQQCSLDYMSASSRRYLANTERAAEGLIDASYVAARRLFIKTHAHSMHAHYSEPGQAPAFPHANPSAETLLSVIFDAAARAGIGVEFLTASEVYDTLLDAEAKPATDLADPYRSSRGRFRRALLGDMPATLTAPRPKESEHLVKTPERWLTASTVELVREVVAEVLGERIARLGIKGSGAYEHYSEMLRLGFPIPNYELAALDIVRRELPRLQAYWEIGSGIGVLPHLLALHGLPSVGIERDRRRHNTAVAIWRELAARAGVAKSRCRPIYGSFPRSGARMDLSGSIAIVTDFVTTQTDTERKAILDGLLHCRYILLDLSRFCVKRETREAQLALLDELAAEGFPAPAETFDPEGSDYAFALFDNPSAGRRRQAFGIGRIFTPWRRVRGLEAAPEAVTDAARSLKQMPDVREQYRKAVELYNARRWAEHVALIEPIAEDVPPEHRRQAYQFRVVAWGFRLDEPARALEICTKGLAEFPDWTDGYIFAARLHQKLRANLCAVRCYKEALRRGDKTGDAAYGIFMILLNRQRHRWADGLLPLIEAKKERFRGVERRIAELHLALGRPDRALAALGESGERPGGDDDALLQLAWSQRINFGRPKLRASLRHIAIGGVSYIGSTVFGIVLGSLEGFANIGESHLLIKRREPGTGRARLADFAVDPPDSWFQCRVCGKDCAVLTREFRERLAQNPAGWYEQVADHLETNFLVSSDKTLHFYRSLDPESGFDLVTLYKRPSSHIGSVKRVAIERGGPDEFSGPEVRQRIERELGNWVQNYSGLMRTIRPHGRRVLLNWERFVAQPVEHFERLLNILELPGSAEVFEHVKPHHFIGGSVTPGVGQTVKTGRFVTQPSSAPPLTAEETAFVSQEEASRSLFRLMETEYRRDFGDLSATR